jgi:plasmid stabilization system protein ParE
MRVRIAISAQRFFQAMLEQGAEKFGVAIAREKERLVYDTLHTYLAHYPHHGLTTPGQRFLHYPVKDTPFTIVYEYNNKDLRVFYILHKHADRRNLDLHEVEW